MRVIFQILACAQITVHMATQALGFCVLPPSCPHSAFSLSLCASHRGRAGADLMSARGRNDVGCVPRKDSAAIRTLRKGKKLTSRSTQNINSARAVADARGRNKRRAGSGISWYLFVSQSNALAITGAGCITKGWQLSSLSSSHVSNRLLASSSSSSSSSYRTMVSTLSSSSRRCVRMGFRSATRLAAVGEGGAGEERGSRREEESEEGEGEVDANTEAGIGEARGWPGWIESLVAPARGAMPQKAEAKKILPLGLMLFFILFDYTILRDTKDVLVVTAPDSGAEVIPFLKTYVNLPGAVAFTVLYSKLCNSAEQNRVFYTVLSTFLAFFAAFAAFLYPNRDVLSTAAMADAMHAFLPEGFSALSSIVRNWTFSLFYLMSELWGSVVVSVLFWGFANDIVSVKEAKRYYPLFGLGANVALIFSGQYVRLVSSVRQSLPPDVDKWGVSLQLLMGAVVAGGAVTAACYHWMQQNVINDPDCVDADSAASMKETTSLTLRESAAFLGSNSYLRDVALLVIAYGTSINIVEVTWKAKLKMAYPDPNDYSAFMGNFSSTTGLITLAMMLFGRQVFQKYGWGTAAQATPIVLLLTGAAFFSLSMFGDAAPVQGLLEAWSTNPLTLAVLAGAAQNVLSKSCKYSLFDPCKEMAYIPLSPEEKRKGKAAVDVIGNPLGKSTGSFVQQGLFLTTGSLQASTPYLGGVLVVVISVWLFAADSLSHKFEKAMATAVNEESATTQEAFAGEKPEILAGHDKSEDKRGNDVQNPSRRRESSPENTLALSNDSGDVSGDDADDRDVRNVDLGEALEIRPSSERPSAEATVGNSGRNTDGRRNREVQ